MVYNILLNAFSAMKKKNGIENSRMPYFNGILLDTEFKLKKKVAPRVISHDPSHFFILVCLISVLRVKTTFFS